MSFDIAKKVIDNIPKEWNSRFEFSLRGEPSLNPDKNRIVAYIRKRFPKASIMMTSNGGGFVGKQCFEKVEAIFDAGLNVLALDDYGHANLIPKIRKYMDDFELAGVELYEHPADKNSSPHSRRKGKHIVFIQDLIAATKGTHNFACNHAGAAAPLDDTKVNTRCHRPFRELIVRYDGSVNLCCNVWTGDFTVGNATTTGLKELWNHEAFMAARKILYHEGRTFAPCYGCDAKGIRAGLLPDKLGKETMPEVEFEDYDLVEEYSHKGRESTILGRALVNIPIVKGDK